MNIQLIALAILWVLGSQLLEIIYYMGVYRYVGLEKYKDIFGENTIALASIINAAIRWGVFYWIINQ